MRIPTAQESTAARYRRSLRVALTTLRQAVGEDDPAVRSVHDDTRRQMLIQRIETVQYIR